MNLARAPLPLLEGHDRTRTNVGIVTNLRVGAGRLRGDLVLGVSARALELAADIASGVVSTLDAVPGLDEPPDEPDALDGLEESEAGAPWW